MTEALGGKPTAAEEKVLAAAKSGDFAKLCPFGIRPKEASPDTEIRAGLIRFLMLGGDQENRVHPKGVQISGAWISGRLDLVGCETQLDLKLFACHFDSKPNFMDARLGGLYLPGCMVPGLHGHRLRLEDNLHLCEVPGADPRLPFHATGPVDINGANITGRLDCEGGRFDGAGGRALNCIALTVGASVFLRHGFHATGEVTLFRANITGQLDCDGGRFDGAGGLALDCTALTVGASVFLLDGFHASGEVSLIRARITGNLQVGNALIEGMLQATSARVDDALFLRDIAGAAFDGPWRDREVPKRDPDASRFTLDLTEAQARVLVDDSASWAEAQEIWLSGFRFRSLQSNLTASERIGILHRAHQDDLQVSPSGRRHFRGTPPDFDPRAFGELARAYLRQGERKSAAMVLEARDDRSRDAELRRAQAIEAPGLGLSTLNARLRWLSLWIFKLLFGYGHRPARVFLTVLPLWAALAWFFGLVFAQGQFAPNSAVILTSPEWIAAVENGCPIAWDPSFVAAKTAGCDMPLTLWTGDLSRNLQPAHAAKDYETFGRWLYAADLFLPLDAIAQTEAWAPSKDRGWWGLAAYYLRFPVQLLGWIIVAMAAAVVTGLIGRKED